MMANEDLLLLAKFLFFRFTGVMPTDKVLIAAIADWKKESF